MRPPKEPCLDPLAQEPNRTESISEAGRPVWLPQNLRNAIRAAQAKVAHAREASRTPRPGDDVEIVPLGTSSSTPTLYRNGPFIVHAAWFQLTSATSCKHAHPHPGNWKSAT